MGYVPPYTMGGEGGWTGGGMACGPLASSGIFKKFPPAASAYANWKPPFWTIPQPEIMKNWPTCIRKKRNLREHASAMTKRSRRAPIHRILFTDVPLLKWQWEISLLPYPTSSAWSRKTESTIFIVPKDCWHTHTPIQASRKERKRYSSRRRRFPRYQKPITTMRRFWLLRIEMRKRKSGRSEFWRRSQPCRDICAAASGPGSEERTVS